MTTQALDEAPKSPSPLSTASPSSSQAPRGPPTPPTPPSPPSTAEQYVVEAPASDIRRLPPELRLKIWSCAVEPQLIFLSDLIQTPKSYPLPAVTQLNAETRSETRQGYERAGLGSYFHFGRDILVCDYQLADQTSSNPVAEKLAPQIQRVVFWDCTPDEEWIRLPDLYSDYLSTCYQQNRFGQVVFDRFWFPNVREFWSVKVGEVDRSWMVQTDWSAPFEARLQQTARQFRYWVDESIIEIAPLDLTDPEARMILREGRCGKEDCHELNAGRTHIFSKVNFLDGKYQEPADGRTWVRIVPSSPDSSGKEEEKANSATTVNRMRWTLVERSLTFFLRYDPPEDAEESSRARRCVELGPDR